MRHSSGQALVAGQGIQRYNAYGTADQCQRDVGPQKQAQLSISCSRYDREAGEQQLSTKDAVDLTDKPPSGFLGQGLVVSVWACLILMCEHYLFFVLMHLLICLLSTRADYLINMQAFKPKRVASLIRGFCSQIAPAGAGNLSSVPVHQRPYDATKYEKPSSKLKVAWSNTDLHRLCISDSRAVPKGQNHEAGLPHPREDQESTGGVILQDVYRGEGQVDYGEG